MDRPKDDLPDHVRNAILGLPGVNPDEVPGVLQMQPDGSAVAINGYNKGQVIRLPNLHDGTPVKPFWRYEVLSKRQFAYIPEEGRRRKLPSGTRMIADFFGFRCTLRHLDEDGGVIIEDKKGVHEIVKPLPGAEYDFFYEYEPNEERRYAKAVPK